LAILIEQKMKQQISEIIDQRLSAEETDAEIGRVARDPEGCRVWRNYHLIGDVIRGESLAGTCLVEKLQSRIEREPTILAPARASTEGSGVIGGSGRSSDTVKSAGLFAVAASLALVAVLTLSPDRDTTPGNLQVQSPAVPTLTPASAAAEAASFESEFGQMLVEHGEFTANSGLNGLITYAKLVSNERLGQ